MGGIGEKLRKIRENRDFSPRGLRLPGWSKNDVFWSPTSFLRLIYAFGPQKNDFQVKLGISTPKLGITEAKIRNHRAKIRNRRPNFSAAASPRRDYSGSWHIGARHQRRHWAPLGATGRNLEFWPPLVRDPPLGATGRHWAPLGATGRNQPKSAHNLHHICRNLPTMCPKLGCSLFCANCGIYGAGCGICWAGCGHIWGWLQQILAGCGPFWLVAAHFGWLRPILAIQGLFWPDLAYSRPILAYSRPILTYSRPNLAYSGLLFIFLRCLRCQDGNKTMYFSCLHHF